MVRAIEASDNNEVLENNNVGGNKIEAEFTHLIVNAI